MNITLPIFNPNPIPTKTKIEFFQNLATMIDAGIPIDQAIASIVEDSDKSSKNNIFNSLVKTLESGKSLNEGMATFPLFFSRSEISVVKAGEVGGTLTESLKILVRTLKEQEFIKKSIKSALTYPGMVMGVMAVVSTVLILFVIPRLGETFLRLNVKIPLPTRILIELSLFLQKNQALSIIGIILIAILIILFIRSSIGKKTFIFILSHIPVTRKIMLEIDLARVSTIFSSLLTSGIPILEVLDLTRDTLILPNVKKTIEQISRDLAAGSTLEAAFEKHRKIYPSTFRRILATGEKSGTLESSMSQVFEYYSTSVSDKLKNISVIIEPVILVIIALGVGGLIISFIGPVYELIGSLNKAI
ncbi:type II secretion system F family protein [Candidatus Curtissbacteria bacterium]|nr:type II secretion system F family protein [Candidatus Curtissbacteria bacterium]